MKRLILLTLVMSLGLGCGNFQEYELPDVPTELRIPPAEENLAALTGTIAALNHFAANINLSGHNISFTNEVDVGLSETDITNGVVFPSGVRGLTYDTLFGTDFGLETVSDAFVGAHPDGTAKGTYEIAQGSMQVSVADSFEINFGTQNTDLELNKLENWEVENAGRFLLEQDDAVKVTLTCLSDDCAIALRRQVMTGGACNAVSVAEYDTKSECEGVHSGQTTDKGLGGAAGDWLWLAESSGGTCSDSEHANRSDCEGDGDTWSPYVDARCVQYNGEPQAVVVSDEDLEIGGDLSDSSNNDPATNCFATDANFVYEQGYGQAGEDASINAIYQGTYLAEFEHNSTSYAITIKFVTGENIGPFSYSRGFLSIGSLFGGSVRTENFAGTIDINGQRHFYQDTFILPSDRDGEDGASEEECDCSALTQQDLCTGSSGCSWDSGSSICSGTRDLEVCEGTGGGSEASCTDHADQGTCESNSCTWDAGFGVCS